MLLFLLYASVIAQKCVITLADNTQIPIKCADQTSRSNFLPPIPQSRPHFNDSRDEKIKELQEKLQEKTLLEAERDRYSTDKFKKEIDAKIQNVLNKDIPLVNTTTVLLTPEAIPQTKTEFVTIQPTVENIYQLPPQSKSTTFNSAKEVVQELEAKHQKPVTPPDTFQNPVKVTHHVFKLADDNKTIQAAPVYKCGTNIDLKAQKDQIQKYLLGLLGTRLEERFQKDSKEKEKVTENVKNALSEYLSGKCDSKKVHLEAELKSKFDQIVDNYLKQMNAHCRDPQCTQNHNNILSKNPADQECAKKLVDLMTNPKHKDFKFNQHHQKPAPKFFTSKNERTKKEDEFLSYIMELFRKVKTEKERKDLHNLYENARQVYSQRNGMRRYRDEHRLYHNFGSMYRRYPSWSRYGSLSPFRSFKNLFRRVKWKVKRGLRKIGRAFGGSDYYYRRRFKLKHLNPFRRRYKKFKWKHLNPFRKSYKKFKLKHLNPFRKTKLKHLNPFRKMKLKHLNPFRKMKLKHWNPFRKLKLKHLNPFRALRKLFKGKKYKKMKLHKGFKKLGKKTKKKLKKLFKPFKNFFKDLFKTRKTNKYVKRLARCLGKRRPYRSLIGRMKDFFKGKYGRRGCSRLIPSLYPLIRRSRYGRKSDLHYLLRSLMRNRLGRRCKFGQCNLKKLIKRAVERAAKNTKDAFESQQKKADEEKAKAEKVVSKSEPKPDLKEEIRQVLAPVVDAMHDDMKKLKEQTVNPIPTRKCTRRMRKKVKTEKKAMRKRKRRERKLKRVHRRRKRMNIKPRTRIITRDYTPFPNWMPPPPEVSPIVETTHFSDN